MKMRVSIWQIHLGPSPFHSIWFCLVPSEHTTGKWASALALPPCQYQQTLRRRAHLRKQVRKQPWQIQRHWRRDAKPTSHTQNVAQEDKASNVYILHTFCSQEVFTHSAYALRRYFLTIHHYVMFHIRPEPPFCALSEMCSDGEAVV
jgi:hypothetical protein